MALTNYLLEKKTTIFEILIRQILSPLIYVLLIAVIFSFLVGDEKDAIFIIAIILVNAVIGAYQEWKAEKSSESLQNFLKITTQVKRDDAEIEIGAEKLVPGDIVFLESGNKVSADIRILEANNLTIDESIITGESLAVLKNNSVIEEEVSLAEQKNMAFAGSIVATGRGMGIVVKTGTSTEIGQLASEINQLKVSKSPLVIRMEKFANNISLIVLVVCAFLAAIELLRGRPVYEVVYMAIALAVSVIPEALPATLTAALSIGMKRMAKRNVIIRELPAVEGLGSCTCIASDKTGTLSMNKQTAKIIQLVDGTKFIVSGEGYIPLGEVKQEHSQEILPEHKVILEKLASAITSANEATLRQENNEWFYKGDSVDIALLALGQKLGIQRDTILKDAEIIKEIPYESELKYAAIVYKLQNETFMAIKGAYEAIVPFCNSVPDFIEDQINNISADGYRVITCAFGTIPQIENPDSFDINSVNSLDFIGMIGLIDPLRTESFEAVKKCREAGIDVVMITGDHAATAFTIAKELGIASSAKQVITGDQLAKVDNYPKFNHVVNKTKVFARVNPLQKLHIVNNLIEAGHFVAVTGDGVNDAPALKKANVSIAMGSGADVAKEVASIIITDDNFASIVAGVEEGRFTYDNIRKCIYLLVTIGASQIILFFLSLMFNLAMPLLPVQLLWLNLVTSGIQAVGLAFESGDPDSMKRPPRKPTEGIFDPLMIQQIILSSATIGLISFGMWYYLLYIGWAEADARTLLLLLMVMFSNLHVFNCRSEFKSLFKIPLKSNYFLIAGVFAAQFISLLAMVIPFMKDFLYVTQTDILHWVQIFLLSVTVCIVMEIFKVIKNRYSKQ